MVLRKKQYGAEDSQNRRFRELLLLASQVKISATIPSFIIPCVIGGIENKVKIKNKLMKSYCIKSH